MSPATSSPRKHRLYEAAYLLNVTLTDLGLPGGTVMLASLSGE
jgi:hypothetical protein